MDENDLPMGMSDEELDPELDESEEGVVDPEKIGDDEEEESEDEF